MDKRKHDTHEPKFSSQRSNSIRSGALTQIVQQSPAPVSAISAALTESPMPKINESATQAPQRQRREIKRLQKYDSHSDDEEDYHDYFSNPQKRKEYDRLKLQQQMREIQNIAGFTLGQFGNNSAFPGANENVGIVITQQQKNYATVSLCCLTVTNPFRNKIIQLVAINPWFDRFILVVIMLNCFTLATDLSFFNEYTEIIETAFLVIYTAEMVLKIIALGFFMRQHSYLREAWNFLDFVVVILGWVLFIGYYENKDQGISSIRVLRILRPLRTINSMPGMSSLVSTILNSLPIMFDIMVLFVFMLIMFGTIATQLLGGNLDKRCMLNGTIMLDNWDMETFCLNDELCKGIDSLSSCQYVGNPNQGTLSFDNVLLSIMNIFQIITLEGWTDMMYIVRQAKQTYVYDLFFVSCVIFGAFFVLNLMIAVQFTYLGEAFDEVERRQKEIKIKIEAAKLQAELKDDDSFFDDEQVDDKIESDASLEQSIPENEGNSARSSNNSNNLSKRYGKNGKLKKKGCCRCCKKPKFCIELSNAIEDIISKDNFQRFITILILINSAFLASEHYNQPQWLTDASDKANLLFTMLFSFEMIFKLMGLGISGYVADGFNIFDSLIVVLSIVELFIPGETSGLSVFRAFRLLRIFKIIKSWRSLQILLITVLHSLSAIANLGALTVLYIFISALLAKQYFNDDLIDSDGELSRYSFKSTGESLVTIFIILTGENWNEIMIQVIDQQKSFIPALFFMFQVIIGHYMLLNLFLAILLKFISQNEDCDHDEHLGIPNNQDQKQNNNSLEKHSSFDKIEEEFEEIKKQLYKLSGLPDKKGIDQIQMEGGQRKLRIDIKNQVQESAEESFQSHSIESSNSVQSNSTKRSEIENKSVEIKKSITKARRRSVTQKEITLDTESKSLFLMSSDNCFRIFLKSIIQHSYFEGFIYHLIALNSLLLALDEPVLTDKFQKNTIAFLQLIISGIFIFECLFKIIVMGFYWGKRTYLKDPWNILDFTLVLLTVLTWLIERFSNDQNEVGFHNGFRALRSLRPLRVVSKNEGIKTLVNSLLQAIPALMNVLLVIILFLFVFGILGVQLFKGMLGVCNDTSSEIVNKSQCIGTYQDESGQQIAREWISPKLNSYDNVFQSMITFFEVSTLEMWPSIMHKAQDSVAIDHVPIRDNMPQVSIIFILFIFVTTFFIMNLFVSVIVDKFNEEIKKRQGADNFTQEQKEWVKIQRLLVHTNPKIIPVEPNNCFRLLNFKLVQSQIFEYFIALAIVVNTIFLCMEYYGQSQQYENVLQQANSFFVGIFLLEVVIKITAYGFTYYWHVNWNKFDFIIITMSIIVQNLEGLLAQLNLNMTALRIIRVSRLLRMVKTSEGLRSLLKTLYMSLGNILNTALLLMLILFTFTVAGMSLFQNVPFGEFINKDANFKSFYIALMTLWRASTGESWNGLMHECYKNEGIIAIIFWVSFQLIAFFIFMNVFIAVIYENFNDINSSEDDTDNLSLKKKDIKAFQNTWAKFNPQGGLYMRTVYLPEFLRELPPPLGYQGIRIEESKLNKIIFCLNIRDHSGTLYYPEVMWSLFHSIAGVNDHKVNNCHQIKNIIKMVKQKYKGLGKKVTLDTLCGNKYYNNELTAIKYLQALKIWIKWKSLKQKNKDGKTKKKDKKFEQKQIQAKPITPSEQFIDEQQSIKEEELDSSIGPLKRIQKTQELDTIQVTSNTIKKAKKKVKEQQASTIHDIQVAKRVSSMYSLNLMKGIDSMQSQLRKESQEQNIAQKTGGFGLMKTSKQMNNSIQEDSDQSESAPSEEKKLPDPSDLSEVDKSLNQDLASGSSKNKGYHKEFKEKKPEKNISMKSSKSNKGKSQSSKNFSPKLVKEQKVEEEKKNVNQGGGEEGHLKVNEEHISCKASQASRRQQKSQSSKIQSEIAPSKSDNSIRSKNQKGPKQNAQIQQQQVIPIGNAQEQQVVPEPVQMYDQNPYMLPYINQQIYENQMLQHQINMARAYNQMYLSSGMGLPDNYGVEGALNIGANGIPNYGIIGDFQQFNMMQQSPQQQSAKSIPKETKKYSEQDSNRAVESAHGDSEDEDSDYDSEKDWKK